MRISDWSSDVCSSDLDGEVVGDAGGEVHRAHQRLVVLVQQRERRRHDVARERRARIVVPRLARRIDELRQLELADPLLVLDLHVEELQIGRASCRERGCQYVINWVGSGYIKQNKKT